MFQAKQTQLLRRGADKSNACRFAGLGKGGVLREKAVTWMDRLRAACLRRCNHFFADQIGVRRRALAQAQGLVGLADMQTADIRFGIDRHAANVHGAQRAQDTAGNRPTVRNQEFRQHSKGSIVTGRPAEN
ncbi:hypothetical protein D3C75_974560 [compost metagenome]